MADVKNIITLGIGAAPGGIEWFVLTGLSPALTPAPADRTYPISSESRTLAVDQETRVLAIEQETRVLAVQE
jgi:hypothetical protein